VVEHQCRTAGGIKARKELVMSVAWRVPAVVVALVSAGVILAPRIAGVEETKVDRYFEMRTYVAAPGKLEQLHARFRDHTNKLFLKHGMQIVGYWTPVEGDAAKSTLIYILAYPSKEAREKSWKGFSQDPDWNKVKTASEVDGKLVSKVESIFLKPTDYSPIK
jgi:hypothetical protein